MNNKKDYQLSTLTNTPLANLIKRYNSTKGNIEVLEFKICNDAWPNLKNKYKHGMLFVGSNPIAGFPLLPALSDTEESIHEGIMYMLARKRIFDFTRHNKRNAIQRFVARLFDL